MKHIILKVGVAACVAVLTGCGGGGTQVSDTHANSDKNEDVRHNHEGVIVMNRQQAKGLGVVVDAVKTEYFAMPVKLAGEVVYSSQGQGVMVAPTSGRVSYAKGITQGSRVKKGQKIATVSASGISGGDQLRAAQIEYEAAKKEVERLELLLADGIVTKAEYNQAVTNLERARNLLSGGAGNVVVAPVSGVVSVLEKGEGDYVETGGRLGCIEGEDAMNMRVGVPVRDVANILPGGVAKVKFPQSENWVEAYPVSGKNFGSGSSAGRSGTSSGKSDESARGSEGSTRGLGTSGEGFGVSGYVSDTPGYVSIYFSLPAVDGIVAGSYAEVYLPTKESVNGVVVPVSAVTDRMGKKMVYVKEPGTDHYRRVAVEIVASDGGYASVRGINAGDSIVTEGVTFVKLAETSGVTPPGHTHNH